MPFSDSPAVVLVIDDDPLNLKMMLRGLEGAGYSALGAPSAEAAAALLRKRLVDAIVADIGLPGMTGLEAISAFRAFSQAPIIIMTGHGDAQLQQDALALGARCFLEKPFELRALAEAVEKTLKPS